MIAVAHRPKVGERVGFALAQRRALARRTQGDARGDATRAAAPPVFGLYFDCVSRGPRLYNIPDHDSAYIGRYLGHLPIAGFFTGFEIGPLGAATGRFNIRGVLALISGKTG